MPLFPVHQQRMLEKLERQSQRMKSAPDTDTKGPAMALGFKKLLDGDVATFGVGAGGFILQRYYQKEWAENCMMQMMVDNLDEWWEHLEALNLPVAFGVQSPKSPAMQPWGCA